MWGHCTLAQNLTRVQLLLLGIVTSLVCPALVTAAETRRIGQESAPSSVLALDDFSPSFLGIYRKVMEIEPDIIKYSRKYGVDPSLARAICMYESGGNANLTSAAGARGYFQVMPATFRMLRLPTNIEAGIKYLGQLVKQFGREDYAVAAYNGGPGRVARGRAMPLESLQYVLGVGYYRSVLQMYELSVRTYVQELGLLTSQDGDNWWTLSQRLEIPLIQLRLHNPFLTDRRLGQRRHLIAYPPHPRRDLLDIAEDGRPQYRARLGDNYFNVAFAFEVDLGLLRTTNQLWRLQILPPGMVLTIPIERTDTFTEHHVKADEDLASVAARLQADPWQIVRNNNLWDDKVHTTAVLRIPPAAPRPTFQVHRVRRGQTLSAIARRYRTTIAAIQAANMLGRSTLIRIGQRLRIPAK